MKKKSKNKIIKKKVKRKKKFIKKKTFKSRKKIKKKTFKSRKKIKKNIKKYKIKKAFFFVKKKKTKKLNIDSKSFLLRIVRFQNKLKFNFKINFGFFSKIEKSIQGFFESIEKHVQDYKIIKGEERRRQKLEEIESKEKERIENKKAAEEEKKLKLKLKEQSLRDEMRLEKKRVKDIKLFLRQEQAIVRKEQAEKQRQFLKQIKLEKQIEKFRIREVKELEKLERISLREQREDYAGLQERIEKLKDKYRIIRDQKIRERVEALGIQIQGDEDRETLLLKEKEYTIARQKIELSLESFYRSANSLVFQLNKRHITRNMSILRCIDRRFETGEIFIKWDESNDDEWLVLIYIKNNSPDEGIIIEDKSNPEKNLSHEFKSNEIFKASDMMVDSLTQLISKERSKKAN
tara:strand:- start:195 stop:1409 length:1215 start_codon:yes stop_codon:yes gene_type:complete